MSHIIKIGIIGPTLIENKIREAVKDFPTFIPNYKISNNIYDAPKFAGELNHVVDVLLFSGYNPYKMAKEQVDLTTPSHYIPLKGSGLYRSLFRLKEKTSISRLTIDTLTEEDLKKVLLEIDETVEKVYDFEGLDFDQKDKMIEFHLAKYQNGQSTGALTGIKYVADALEEKGVPVEWVIPTKDDIIVALERALLSTETRKHKESHIVVGLIKVDNYEQIERRTTKESERQKLKLEIYRMLLDYVDCLDGYLTNIGTDEYLFVTTRGIFERETKGYKTIPILKQVDKNMGITISIGVGFGFSANQAGNHARLALHQSRDFGGNTCFIVREDRSAIGPVDMTAPLVYELSVTDPDLLERAEKSGMTASYMSKLIAQVKRYGKREYTAQDLASVLGISIRSTHRILIKWLDAELVEIIGEEKLVSKGRPRQIYRISIV